MAPNWVKIIINQITCVKSTFLQRRLGSWRVFLWDSYARSLPRGLVGFSYFRDTQREFCGCRSNPTYRVVLWLCFYGIGSDPLDSGIRMVDMPFQDFQGGGTLDSAKGGCGRHSDFRGVALAG